MITKTAGLTPEVRRQPFECVVAAEQVYRETRSGVLYEVVSVTPVTNNASVVLRRIDLTEDGVFTMLASALCAGSAWEPAAPRRPSDAYRCVS